MLRRPPASPACSTAYGPMGPPTLFTIPILRYIKTYGLMHEQLAIVSVVQREWAGKNPRATFETPITVASVSGECHHLYSIIGDVIYYVI